MSTVDDLMALADDLATGPVWGPQRAELYAAIERYGQEQYERGRDEQRQIEFMRLDGGRTEREQDAEPVAWSGVDLDSMAEAFHRVIEAQANKDNPFHQPINADAMMALRTLKALIPAMKAYAPPPKRKPLTDEQRDRLLVDLGDDLSPRSIVRATERAHGIGDE